MRPIVCFLVALALLGPGAAFARDGDLGAGLDRPHTGMLAFDLGGETLAAGLHYEHVVARLGSRHRLLARAGLGYLPAFVDGKAAAGNLLVPIGARYLLGFGAHHLEVGLAVPLRVVLGDPGAGPRAAASLVPSVGWRYQDFGQGRWFMGVAYSPRLTQGVLGPTYGHWARVSVGLRL